LAPTLPFRILIVLNASLKLFWRPWPLPVPLTCPSFHATWLFLGACHLPLSKIPLAFLKVLGLEVLADNPPAGASSWCVSRRSFGGAGCSKSGNLKVSVRVFVEEERRRPLFEGFIFNAEGAAREQDAQLRSKCLSTIRLLRRACGYFKRWVAQSVVRPNSR